MKISEVSISRPVFGSMMSLALVRFGVLGYQRLAVRGDYGNSISHLLTLPTLQPQRVACSVPERYAGSLKLGQQVAFQVAALADNSRGSLPPGMFIEARLATEMRPASVKSTDVVRRPQGVREP